MLFTNFLKQLPAPFVNYANFECITTNVKHRNNTKAYQERKACGYGYNVVCHYDDNYNKPAKVSRRSDTVYKLIANVLEEEKYLEIMM